MIDLDTAHCALLDVSCGIVVDETMLQILGRSRQKNGK